MTRLVFTVLVSILLVSSGQAENEIYELIQEGHLEKAAEKLSERITAANRDGNTLFYQSLLEDNADRAAKLMEASLRTSVDAEYQEQIYYRLAQYYYLEGEYEKLSRHLANYRVRWEQGDYRLEMRRLSILVDQESDAYESAIRQCDRYLISSGRQEDTQWGKVDKARVMMAYDKSIAGRKLLEDLSRERSGEGVPQALYMLADDAIDGGRTDDALFYYSILREGYQGSVGLESLVNRMSGLEAGGYDSDEAEKVTGTFYSVQVGVFSEKDNAKRMAKRFKPYDRKVEIRSRTISDKKYNVVYVGHFGTYESARRFQEKLELTFGEVYQVVAR